MGVTATVRVDVSGIPRKVRRICPSRKVGQFAAEDARRLMERFVPFRDGQLRASAIVSPFLVTYTAPYAHYQWEGVAKGGGRLYHPTPGTMSHWERYIDKAQLARDVADFVRMM